MPNQLNPQLRQELQRNMKGKKFMLRTKMNAVISEVSDSLAEREELIHTIALA